MVSLAVARSIIPIPVAKSQRPPELPEVISHVLTGLEHQFSLPTAGSIIRRISRSDRLGIPVNLGHSMTASLVTSLLSQESLIPSYR